ncbi:MAG: hypothetical protein J7485_05340 [Sphingobium sp.]|nr:hypothetical protein [Sphingobium sp.]
MSDFLTGAVRWIETLQLHEMMVNIGWAVPLVQTIHILAIAVVFGSSIVLSLRALQLAGGDLSPADWGARLNGWIGWAVLLLLLTGALMICGEPGRSLLNTTFQIKMLLTLVAVVLFMVLARRMRLLDKTNGATPGAVRLLGVLLPLLWLAIITCGRWIAYT